MKDTYFLPGNILLPKENFEKWSVIACDQFTSEPEYWHEIAAEIGDSPSSLNMILPEAFLSKDNSEKINKINKTMHNYLENNVFNEFKDTIVYVEREITGGKIRKGIVGLIDLENYSYKKDAKTLIRATEATIIERIPPRVQIRKDAPLEMPHIMLLIDDPNFSVIEPLANNTENFDKLYDFNLIKNSGNIKGFALNKEYISFVQNALANLIEEQDDKLLFAVGDGNHSLATAKECYELDKENNTRFALVEVVNIHDSSLEFEPIYRVLFNINPEKFIEKFLRDFGGEYFGSDAQKFELVYGKERKTISLKPTGKLSVATLQTYLDKFLSVNSEITIDYIHGEDSVYNICSKPNTLGFIFEGMKKSELFEAIKKDGSTPRKTFSMGHAVDKRFYLESVKIK